MKGDGEAGGDRKAEEEPIAELLATTPGPPAKTRQRFGGVGRQRREAPPASPSPFTGGRAASWMIYEVCPGSRAGVTGEPATPARARQWRNVRSQTPKSAPWLNRNDGLITTWPEEWPLVVSTIMLVVHGPVIVPWTPE